MILRLIFGNGRLYTLSQSLSERVPADQPVRTLEPDDAAVRGRKPDRSTRIRREGPVCTVWDLAE
jgi:hypothetical protein